MTWWKLTGRIGRRPWLRVTLVVGLGLAACGDSGDGDDDDEGAGGIAPFTGAPTGTGTASGSGTGAGTTTGTGAGSGESCGHYGEEEPTRLQGMTAAHNAVRCAVQPASGGALPMLEWSSTVAASAQSWADQLAANGCDLQHSSGPYGENLFWGSGSYSPADAVDGWASELSCFTYGEFPGCCSCTCGHYTQIVWRDSRYVGCAVAECGGGGEVWVCQYDPPGNYLGNLPY